MKTLNICSSSSLVLFVVLLAIGYQLICNISTKSTALHNSSLFDHGNILNAENLTLSKELTSQVISTVTRIVDGEPDLDDIDIWATIFYSICCKSSLFRRKIWEKEVVYLPLSRGLHNKSLDLMFKSLPHLNDIQQTYKLFEYEILYESKNNFFISEVIKPPQATTNQRIGPRAMKSGLKHSTLVMNKAGLIFDDVHDLEVSTMKTFGYPVNTNVYFSYPSNPKYKMRQNISSRIHTDRQDAFIVQISGSKRWQMWRPRAKLAHFREQRGKDDDDHYSPPRDLGLYWNETLMDVVLNAGDILYVPRAVPHQVSVVGGEEVSIHLNVGLETESAGLTMDNMLLCILGKNARIGDSTLNQLTQIIFDIVKHDEYSHFRRSIPFGFNYNKNDADNTQIFNRIQNLTNSVFEMKQRIGEKKKSSKKRKKIVPSKKLINEAYDIFLQQRNDLIQTYTRKLDVIEGENWNEKQDKLKEKLIRKIKKYFGKCSIDVSNTDMLFGLNIGK